MKIVRAIVFGGLLMSVEPAGAETVYSLTVSHHPSVRITTADVEKIFEDATKIMKRSSCDVTFKLSGSVRPFTSPQTPARIDSEQQRDAVHRESTDVKVVEKINFCRRRTDHDGCAFPPNPRSRSIIVVRRDAALEPILWAHEFGHRMGLPHRSERRRLMTICDLARNQVQITREECNCFLNEGSCTLTLEQINRPMQCARR